MATPGNSGPKPVILDPASFDPANRTDANRAFDIQFRENIAKAPFKWWEIGAAEHRRLRRIGGTGVPAPIFLDSAVTIKLPSREAGRDIPCRLVKPQNGKQAKAIFLHIHGGGWVLGDHEGIDPRLQTLADTHGLICLSVGYRLAPEHPNPAPQQDCYDVAEWLVLNGEKEYGVPLGFVGGDSAGGQLSMVTTLHLLQHEDKRFSEFKFKGLMLHYGCFDLSLTPSAQHMGKHEKNLLLDTDSIQHFRSAFVPNWTLEKLREPEISPLYWDLEPFRGKLPPAVFTVGTLDCLLDDTLFMSARWLAFGGDTTLEVVNGAQHGYAGIPTDVEGGGSAQGWAAVDKFIQERI